MPRRVELVAHDPAWGARAERLGSVFAEVAGSCVLAVHHIGSTGVEGMRAKPIIDLMPVVSSLSALDEVRGWLCAAGYDWRGEQGLAGRRYLTLSDPVTGHREAHLHCYAEGDGEITRHLAFRDLLRSRSDLARAYVGLKETCRNAHPLDSAAYTECKAGWIADLEARVAAGAV